ncbi:MAG: DmsE family decaheme c-type cytochrome [Gammaproteobacteria bacterium]
MNDRNRVRGFGKVVPLAVIAAALLAFAQRAPAAEGRETAADAVRSCTRCHDAAEKYPVLSILKSKHAVMADPRTPFADQACVSCHGASEAHVRAPEEEGARAAPDIVFRKAATASADQNQVCLDCHSGGDRMHWKSSAHAFQDLACSSCHTVHAGEDPVLVTQLQPEVCFDCHQNKRAEIRRPFAHPLREGEMACSDCHNPHGSAGPVLLAEATVNETCYGCHADKRGPFLWEHQPVREDCTYCHKPHGSAHPGMLKNRAPWLCQQCHLAQFHPSTAYSGTGLPGPATPSGAQQVLGKSCLNCHSQVHGSNHPSGVRKTR